MVKVLPRKGTFYTLLVKFFIVKFFLRFATSNLFNARFKASSALAISKPSGLSFKRFSALSFASSALLTSISSGHSAASVIMVVSSLVTLIYPSTAAAILSLSSLSILIFPMAKGVTIGALFF